MPPQPPADVQVKVIDFDVDGIEDRCGGEARAYPLGRGAPKGPRRENARPTDP